MYSRGFILFLWLNITICELNAQCNAAIGVTIPEALCREENYLFEFPDDNILYNVQTCIGAYKKQALVESVSSFSEVSYMSGGQILKDKSDYYFFSLGRTSNNLIRVKLNDDLDLSAGIGENLGNIDNMLSGPMTLKILNKDGKWYGFIFNYPSDTITLLRFGTSLANSPSAVNIAKGNGGNNIAIDAIVSGDDIIVLLPSRSNGLTILRIQDIDAIVQVSSSNIINTSRLLDANGLRGLSLYKDCNNWYGIATSYSNKKIYMLDFEEDPFSEPIGIDISTSQTITGNPQAVWFTKEGTNFIAFVIDFNGNITRLFFGNNINNLPQYQKLNNIPSLGTTLYISGFIKEENRYLITSHYGNSTSTLLKFDSDCPVSDPFITSQDNKTISYSAPGTYDITLTATDENGNSSSVTKQITVLDQQAPQINIQTDANLCLDNSKTFTAQNLTPSQTLTSHTWDFGDGTTASGSEVTHQYTAPGTYKVRLSVEADGGCGNFIEKDVNIYEAPEPDFSFPTDVLCTNGAIAFQNLTPGDFKDDITWLWDFGDGTTASERNPSHTYTSGGTKTVTLTASIPGCSASVSHALEVIEGPNVDFSATNLCFGEEVQFNNLTVGDDITAYAWDFGNGEVSSDVNPAITYGAPGTYTVSLMVSTASGCSTTTTKSIIVRGLPEVGFVHAMACSGLTTAFEDRSVVVEGSINSWLWDFGDGHTSTLKNPAHAFEEPGTYEVKLIATSSHGCVDSTTQAVLVKAAPKADFNMEIGCVGALSRFVDTSIVPEGDEILNRVWVINSATFYSRNPEVPFTQPGAYDVKLTVTSSNGCISSTTKTIFIDPLPAVDFAIDNACVGERVSFTDLSQVAGEDRIVDWQWQFGGVSTSEEQHPEVVFPQAGNVLVTLTVTTERGCTENIHRTIVINGQPQAAFTVNKKAGAPPLQVNFTNNSIGAVSYQWLFGDGDNSTSDEANPTFTYNEIGRYEAKLVATNAVGCADTASVFIETLDPKMDVAIEAVNVFTIAGNVQTVLKLTNKGSMTVQDFDILIDLGGQITLKEMFSGDLGVGESINYPLSIRLSEQEMAKVPYICVTLIVDNADFVEVDTENNRACKEIAKEFVLLNPYPNPVEDRVYLNFVMPEQQTVTLTVMNNLGKVVMDKALEGTEVGLNEYALDISTLPAGSYILQVHYQDKTYLRKVMIR